MFLAKGTGNGMAPRQKWAHGWSLMGEAPSGTRLCRIFEVRERSSQFIPNVLGNCQRVLILGVVGLDPGFSVKAEQGQQ